MAKRDVRRNSRGQIVSYEILGVNDSTQDTPQYGDVEIKDTGEDYTEHGIYDNVFYSDGRLGFKQIVDTTISDEFRRTFTQPDPAIGIGDWLGINDFIGHQPPLSTTQIGGNSYLVAPPLTDAPQGMSPFGFPGEFPGQTVIIEGTSDAYTWNGTVWQFNPSILSSGGGSGGSGGGQSGG